MSSGPRRTIDLSALGQSLAYRFLISAIAPRPIAWVTTRGADGSTNLAPFSFFQGVSADPPTLMISIEEYKKSGEAKDTLSNIRATREFVVNVVGEPSLETMVRSSAELPRGVSEIEQLGLGTFPAERVAAPCLSDSPVNFECRLHREVPVGASTAVFGEILLVHADERVLDENGNVDPDKLRPVARLGGTRYLVFDPADVRKLRRP